MFKESRHDRNDCKEDDVSAVLKKLYSAKSLESDARKALRRAKESNNAAVIAEANEAYKAARVRRRLVVKEVRAAGIEVTDSGVVINAQNGQPQESREKKTENVGHMYMSQQKTGEKKHIRLYTIDSLDDISGGRVEFVAEFADKKLADNYCKYMLGKKRFAGKGIAIEEVAVKGTFRAREVVAVITPGGEVLDMLSGNL